MRTQPVEGAAPGCGGFDDPTAVFQIGREPGCLDVVSDGSDLAFGHLRLERARDVRHLVVRQPGVHDGVREQLDRLGSIQWPCNAQAPEGTPTMHVDEFVRGKGYFAVTEFVPTEERANKRFPLLLTTGRILSQYNVGAQTRRTENSTWHEEDLLEIHSHDAQERGINEGDWVGIQSRVGTTVLHAHISDRVKPGVIYTTFHHPVSGANVVTTDNSDWATNCPEYKVTAVEVRPDSAAGARQ